MTTWIYQWKCPNESRQPITDTITHEWDIAIWQMNVSMPTGIICVFLTFVLSVHFSRLWQAGTFGLSVRFPMREKTVRAKHTNWANRPAPNQVLREKGKTFMAERKNGNWSFSLNDTKGETMPPPLPHLSYFARLQISNSKQEL